MDTKNVIQPLSPDYYLKNFRTLLDFVFHHYANILNETDDRFYGSFGCLPENAQMLYVRLISRKPEVFRYDRLKYPEIHRLKEAAEALHSEGFLSDAETIPDETKLRTFTKPEILEMLREYPEAIKAVSKLGKDDLINYTINYYSDLIHIKLKDDHKFLIPEYRHLVSIYMLLFFGNTRQTLSDSILEDIGVLRYAGYQLTGANGIFTSRKIAEEWIEASRSKEDFNEALREKDAGLALSIAEQVYHRSYHPRITEKLRNLLGRAGQLLEREGAYEHAVRYYAASAIPSYRERHVRVLLKQDKTFEARQVFQSIHKNPLSPGEEEFVRRFESRLEERSVKSKTVVTDSFPVYEIELRHHDTKQSIEQAVLIALEKKGYRGFYAENHLWKALFGLLFWDVIFTEVDGQFFNPYQRGPADLFDPEFRNRRAQALKQRLEKIKTMADLAGKVTASYHERVHTANHLINWKKVSCEMMESVVSVVPGDHLTAIFDRMSRNLKLFTSGFPDLFLFTQESTGYMLAEVKGPGDQLRANQKGWMRYFRAKGIPFRIIKASFV